MAGIYTKRMDKNFITLNTTGLSEFKPPKGLEEVILEDSEFETVSVSFLIHRSKGDLKESIPLLNVNLLYE